MRGVNFFTPVQVCNGACDLNPVSYTHLDVYKRQNMGCVFREIYGNAIYHINLQHEFYG